MGEVVASRGRRDYSTACRAPAYHSCYFQVSERPSAPMWMAQMSRRAIRNLAASAHCSHGRYGSERDTAFDQRANRTPWAPSPTTANYALQAGGISRGVNVDLRAAGANQYHFNSRTEPVAPTPGFDPTSSPRKCRPPQRYSAGIRALPLCENRRETRPRGNR